MTDINFNQIKPISDLQRKYNELVKQSQDKGAIIFLRRNKPVSVLMSYEEWEKLEATKKQCEELEALASIEKSENEYKNDKAKKLQSLKSLI